jgi:TPR repeat protein
MKYCRPFNAMFTLALFVMTGTAIAQDMMPWEIEEASQQKPPARTDPVPLPPSGEPQAVEKSAATTGGETLPWENEPKPAQKADPLADLRRKAEGGDARAQYNLASEYYSGKSVAKDEKEVIKWIMKAANNGYGRAQYDVGFGHENGKVWKKDLDIAFNWYKKAADNGYHKAMASVGRCYEFGIGVGKDADKAFAYSKASAAGNDIYCLNRLAHCYEVGVGTDVDLNEALRLYKKAKEGGGTSAEQAIARVTGKIKQSEQAKTKEKKGSSLEEKVKEFDKNMDSFVNFLDDVLQALPEE